MTAYWTVTVIAVVVVAVIAWLLASSREKSKLAGSESTIENLKAELAKTENELRLERTRADEVGQARATLEAELKHVRESLSEDRKHLEELKQSFKVASGEALESSSKQFLTLAGQNFAKHVESISGLLKPMRDTLSQMEKDRIDAASLLREQLTKLTTTTDGLETALRKPQVRGSWGELVLKNAVELAGMKDHCDFVEQVSSESEQGGQKRPDMTVRLPGGRTVVVDSKVPLTSFRSALEATDEEDRTRFMQAHAAAVRGHIQSLSKKEYWKQFEHTPDFVILFLPGESFFSAALEADHTLIEDGIRSQVLLATPTTLIAMLRTIAFCWQQQQREENAKKIAEAGTELYSRLCVFAKHWAQIRKGLDQASEAFDSSMGSWNRRLLPAAERLKTLGAAPSESRLEEMEAVRPITHEDPRLIEENTTVEEGQDDASGQSAGTGVEGS